MNNKITFPELVRLVAEATSTTQRMSELFLKELFATVSQALIDGQNVTIKNLGTFEFAKAAARQVVNVQNGEQIDVPTHHRLVFTPDKALAEAINQPFAAFEPIMLSDDMTDEMLQNIDNEMQPNVGEEQPEEPADTPSHISPLMPPPFEQTAEPIAQESDDAQETIDAQEPADVQESAKPALVAAPEPSIQVSVESDKREKPHETGQPTVEHYLKAEHEHEKRKIAHNSFLKGLATGILSTLALGAIIWGAWSSGRNSALSVAQPAVQADTIADTTKSEAHTSAQEVTSSTQEVTASDVVTDTCTATMYLSKMSTKHYGKPDFWIYIYEENRDKIADPNNVTPGTVVVVPPATKYGIDPKDKSSIDRARRRTYDLLSGK